ncbi:RNA 2',3'-cyclic phosphodiesterase [Rhodoferax sp.]|uniref:RNA 2',3'-cyclic phosphodiesterase n=1 Tax=Rhodoferax sp. TaxID=50421 RepID=UPI001A0E9059|nr:RNA 2',3'-cyclic phosphodiesterase [Rhodoferax sp.]MBE0474590.1 RNA 2',3'-cyclic phosphodiesterase [Rhodoferax sp.]
MDSAKPPVLSRQRLFLALLPDDGVRRQLAAHAEQWRWPAGCVRYAPQDWHATLHFIGAVASEKVRAIATAAALPFQPFDLVFDQPRLWPRGLAVLCASELPAALTSLHQALGQALGALDLALDKRPYVPHVTLARHADAAIPPPACKPVLWPVRGFALVVSTGLKAPRYRVLRQYL